MNPVTLTASALLLVSTCAMAGPGAAAKPAPAKGSATKRVELNSATRAQLMTLPGVTPDDADKIIKGRPYNVRSEVISRGILPPESYPTLKGLMTVVPPAHPRSRSKK